MPANQHPNNNHSNNDSVPAKSFKAIFSKDSDEGFDGDDGYDKADDVADD